MLPPLSTAGWVDLSIGDSLFGEKEQARLLAGEQLPCFFFFFFLGGKAIH